MTHILIVSSPYYPAIAAELVAGAEAALAAAGASYEHVEVPGAFEIPAAIAFALPPLTSPPLAGGSKGGYDGFIALGCVIRGETTHYDYVCAESARGLMELTIRQHAAIGYGIVTVENEAQAIIRADRANGDKGGVAAAAFLRMIALKRHFDVAV